MVDTYTCKCRLDSNVCNQKQIWKNDKYKCECKELIDKGRRDKRLVWNPSNWNVSMINHAMWQNI